MTCETCWEDARKLAWKQQEVRILWYNVLMVSGWHERHEDRRSLPEPPPVEREAS